jgi:hypothetical protein
LLAFANQYLPCLCYQTLTLAFLRSLPHQATGFALFVKDNYATLKAELSTSNNNSGGGGVVSHKEVMAAMSGRWKLEKEKALKATAATATAAAAVVTAAEADKAPTDDNPSSISIATSSTSVASVATDLATRLSNMLL